MCAKFCPSLLICDLQEKFRGIHGYPHVLETSRKLLEASRILGWNVLVTTQIQAKLGQVCGELDVSNASVSIDKTKFSMVTPEIESALAAHKAKQVAIVGIESHVCVLQTTLDLLARGYQVFVMADGVSSMNPQEVPVALERLGRAGATITTSESFVQHDFGSTFTNGQMFEVMGDASIPEFKSISTLIKDTKGATKSSLEYLLSSGSSSKM